MLATLFTASIFHLMLPTNQTALNAEITCECLSPPLECSINYLTFFLLGYKANLYYHSSPPAMPDALIYSWATTHAVSRAVFGTMSHDAISYIVPSTSFHVVSGHRLPPSPLPSTTKRADNCHSRSYR